MSMRLCKTFSVLFVLSALLVLSFLFAFPASAISHGPEQGDTFKAPSEIGLTDGLYTIVNKGTGKSLDVFDFIYDETGRAYIERISNTDGQLFRIKRQDNGRYLIYPQSENGLYVLAYYEDIMEGDYVYKQGVVGRNSEFDFVSEGYSETEFRIIPSGMNDPMLSLGVSSERAKNGASYAAVRLDLGDDRSLWTFEKVSDEALGISGGYIGVRKGKTVSLRSRVTPDYLTGSMTWYSSDPSVATVDFNGTVTGVGEGQAVITVAYKDAYASCTVNVSENSAFTWYSQHNVYNGGWDAEPVANLRLTTSYGLTKTFFINNYNHELDWMDEGCKLCAEAMVLSNLGATGTGYDMRYDKLNDLPPDPYTVMLANTGATGYDIQSARLYIDPIMVSNSNINSRFTVNGRRISTSTVYTGSLTVIKNLLEAHPEGVIVEMHNYGRDIQHYLVFTKCLNPDDPNGNYEFLVCDSSAVNASDGDNVPFTSSYSYTRIGYRYSNITAVQYYTVSK